MITTAPLGRSLRWAAFVTVALAVARPVSGQSLTSGGVSGNVVDPDGRGVSDALVLVSDAATGTTREAMTGRGGAFAFTLLPAGEYAIRVERIGYRPKLLTNVWVSPGSDLSVGIAILPVPPPVTRIDTVVMPGATTTGTRAGVSRGFPQVTRDGLPDVDRGVGELLRIATATDEAGLEGLPLGFSRTWIDGVPHDRAGYPGPTPITSQIGVLPRSAFNAVEVMTNAVDVEWSGAAGAALVGYGRRGSRDFRLDVFGDWTGDAVTSSDFFNASARSLSSIRGGARFAGPIIRDTAHFALSVEGAHIQRPMEAALTGSGANGRIIGFAADSFAVGLDGYTRAQRTETTSGSAFGRFDWQIAGTQRLSVHAGAAKFTSVDPDLGLGRARSLGIDSDGLTVSAGLSLTSQLLDGVHSELRIGVDRSNLAFRGNRIPTTLVVSSGTSFGMDPQLPATVRRSQFWGQEVVYFTVGAHILKIGGAVDVLRADDTQGWARDGVLAFGDPVAFANLDGTFYQSVGGATRSPHSSAQLGVFLQDTWRAGPGLRLTMGLRYDRETLPIDKIALVNRWLTLTGIANNDVSDKRNKLSPRAGITWDVGNRNSWIVRVQGGRYYGRVDPAALSEALTHDGAIQMRRAAGSVGSWPTVPDSATAPITGPLVTLLGPDHEAPRSSRGSLGITRSLGAHAALHLVGAYRHTDFLGRRHDLNLLSGAASTDQDGRVLYGTLVKSGGMLSAAPGSNRRFDEFDFVTVIDPDGYSDYWGFTAAIDGALGGVGLSMAYTYSQTTDNWLVGPGSTPLSQLTPFPDSLGAEDWADGVSSFDVPHDFVLAAEIPLPLGARLAGLYRIRSGYPFTPGFPAGVDANGDGSSVNDPAFVNSAAAGMSTVFDQWPCVAAQAQQFARRNSCRGPSQQRLDLRLSIGLRSRGHFRADLIVDAIAVLEPDGAMRDAALYRLDPAAPLTVDPTTGVTTVPVAVNPGFGRELRSRSTGRYVRFGLRLGL